MEPGQLIAFIVVAAVGSYIQAFTGFAFGLVVMSVVGLFGLMPVESAALIVGLLTLVNAGYVALTGQRAIDWRVLAVVLLGAMFLLPAGYFLLRYLSAEHVTGLSLVLGLVVMVCSLSLSRPVRAATKMASPVVTLFYGAASGLMTGLLSAGGPPLVYHLYRQPLSLAAIRETLTTVFALNQLGRLGLAALAGALAPHLLWTAGLAMPAVMGGAALAKRYPPPLPVATFRKAVAFLLFASGAALAIPAMIAMLGSG